MLRFHLFLREKAGPRSPVNGQRGPKIMCLNLRRISTMLICPPVSWSLGDKGRHRGEIH